MVDIKIHIMQIQNELFVQQSRKAVNVNLSKEEIKQEWNEWIEGWRRYQEWYMRYIA
jgi:hypothetical protein